MAKNMGERPIDKATRGNVWTKYMGNTPEGKCFCCKMRAIHYDDFQAGHVKSRANGGSDSITNLRPICAPCNRGMGKMNLLEYQKEIYGNQSCAGAPRCKQAVRQLLPVI